MNQDQDAIFKLEHHHLIIEKIIDDLRDAIQSVLREDMQAIELRATFEEFMSVADDEVYEHFDREEQVLFPFLTEHIPDAKPAVERLERSHDRICGLTSRLERLLSQGDSAFQDDFDSLVMLFTRFEANFKQHAKEEQELLNKMGAKLHQDQLQQLKLMLSEI